MNNDLKTFPSNVAEALALEYVRQQNLSGKSPREIMRLYDKALLEISAESAAIRTEKAAARHSLRK